MKKILTALAVLALGACANPDLPPTPAAKRNVISAGVGVASVMTDCVDGKQKSTPGVGAGFTLTGCLQEREVATPRDRPVQPDAHVGILSVGAGLAVTVSNCYGWRLSGFGVGLGVVAAPCPGTRY